MARMVTGSRWSPHHVPIDLGDRKHIRPLGSTAGTGTARCAERPPACPFAARRLRVDLRLLCEAHRSQPTVRIAVNVKNIRSLRKRTHSVPVHAFFQQISTFVINSPRQPFDFSPYMTSFSSVALHSE